VLFAIALLGIPVGPATAQPVASFADLAERLSPAVVNIATAQTIEQPERNGPQVPEGSPFEDLFRDFFENGQPRAPQTVQSLGSGFIISPEGYIVTNNHVIEEADEITVNFTDGSSLIATLVGTDPKVDLALLKVEPSEPLPFVSFGDSDVTRVGDWVLAIGNPFGLGGSVSAGIVSARNRDINAGPYDDFIQTDAAINRGNSGGPLFNMAGEVIGVNSAIYSPNGGSVGVGFAIPSNIVKTVVAQLKLDGSVARGWLGVAIQTVTPEIAAALELDEAKGALVANVAADGPSHGMLRAGDLILAFDGKPVRDSHDLPKLVGATEAGISVDIDILRQGAEISVAVKIGELETERHAANTNASVSRDGAESERLSATVTALSPESRRALGLDDTVNGAVITSLETDGTAAKAGLKVGDVIVQVGSTPVTSAAELNAALDEAHTTSALLLVNRRGGPFFVGVKLAA